ncbi:MFS transporter [Acidihalobacter ferrooxydans]|uniref:MFS transporter n=1 Tax=Acidihalobacter ferrooxydans TaxID=1765967 RepID=A0A1P8UE87_9GAMM|nr:MFS transporter [Acidihalobacter ferrooxydans]APZ42155.1 MFS transporter [Acidihalobacter ferrooxydans]
MPNTHEQTTPDVSASLLLLFATGTGLAVATLYYNQPMLAVIGLHLHASPSALGWIPTLTQLGYAAGILFLAPLGDRHDRRSVILIKGVVLILALLGAAYSPSIALLGAASFLIGLSATLAQDIVPAAAHIAPAAKRGRIVGKVMTGLLLGILLSRVVSGLVAAQAGWRTMFLIAAASITVFWLIAWRRLPAFEPTTRLNYRALLASLGHLWIRHSLLRRAAIAQGFLSLAFGGFWSTLAVMLHAAPFHLNSAAAGAYGLAGAAGALAAPLAGRFADHGGPERVTRVGAALVAVSFTALFALPWSPVPVYLTLIAISSIGFDLGIQSSLIAHQSIIYGLDHDARGRLTAILVTAMFIGMAIGSALSSILLEQIGWLGVVGFAVFSGLAALATRLWPGA